MNENEDDPYVPPEGELPRGGHQGELPENQERLPFAECPECGSEDLSADSVLRDRPSILAVILFGWLFLLVRAAFVKKTAVCRECGASQRYKTEGAIFAMCMLVILAGIVVASFWL